MVTHAVIPILPRTQFNMSFLAAAGTRSVELAKAVNLLPFTSHQLVVWIHDLQMSAGQTVVINGLGTYPSPFDAREFTDAAARINVNVTSTDTPPKVETSAAEIADPYLKVILTATQGGTANAALYVDLSAALVLRRY
jgi:hypothetical protein